MPPGVQVWVQLDKKNYALVEKGISFNETFCRSGATAGSYDLPNPGEVRLAITTVGKSAPPDVEIKVITSPHPCPKQVVVVPGIAIGELHLGMTFDEAHKAAPRHTGIEGTIQTPEGTVQPEAFNVHNALVVAEFINGRIGALLAGGHTVHTTDGISGLSFLFPHYQPGTDDYAGPVLLPGSTLGQFGTQHCKAMQGNNPPSRYCWHQDPPTRYTFATAELLDPCPTDAGPSDNDHDSDQRVCDYQKDWYIGGLAVTTQKGFKLADYFFANFK
jgi:hypothetical protein